MAEVFRVSVLPLSVSEVPTIELMNSIPPVKPKGGGGGGGGGGVPVSRK